MKLSQLESLVKAMRVHANASQIADPDVRFYDDKRADFIEAANAPVAFMRIDILPNAEDQLRELVVVSDGELSSNGDYEIPLVIIKEVRKNSIFG